MDNNSLKSKAHEEDASNLDHLENNDSTTKSGIAEDTSGTTNTQLIGARLRSLRKKHKLTLEQVGKMIGTTKFTMQRYEAGKVANIPAERIRQLASIYNVDATAIVSDKPIIQMDFLPDVENIDRKKLSDRLNELVNEDGIIQYSDMFPDKRADKTTYAAIVIKDDSMAPDYKKYDQVRYKAQEKYQNGESVIVGIADEALFVRRIHFQKNGSIILQALDPALPPVMYTQKEVNELPVKILGVPIELRRIF